MTARRILIVTSGALCRNPRVLKEATTLGKAGFDVTVLTFAESALFEAQDRALLETAPFHKIAIDPSGSAAPLHLGRFLRRAGRWLARNAVRTGIETPLALGPAHLLARRARELTADLTIVHNELPHWVGTRLLRAGRCVAADIEDWHSEDLLPAERRGRPLRLLRQSESILLHQARYCSTTSHTLACTLAARFGGRRPIVITNSFPLQAAPHACTSEIPAFLWFSQTIGPGRGLEQFVAAWNTTQPTSRLILLGEARPDFMAHLRAQLSPTKQAFLHTRSLVPPTALPTVIAEHDIGLALESAAITNRDLTITNKILQYLNAGLAVVASNTAGQREVLANAPGAGLLVELDDTAALAKQLDTLLRDRARIGQMGAAARAAAERTYCWEREAPRLIATVQAALNPP